MKSPRAASRQFVLPTPPGPQPTAAAHSRERGDARVVGRAVFVFILVWEAVPDTWFLGKSSVKIFLFFVKVTIEFQVTVSRIEKIFIIIVSALRIFRGLSFLTRSFVSAHHQNKISKFIFVCVHFCCTLVITRRYHIIALA